MKIVLYFISNLFVSHKDTIKSLLYNENCNRQRRVYELACSLVK